MEKNKEIKIALVAIVGILVMYFGINFLKGISIFSHESFYYMTFEDIQGMGTSTPIYADGYKVGTVDAIEYDYSQQKPIRVKADISQELRIPEGSQAEIQKDLMGNLQVNLLLANNPRQRIEPGSTIPGVVNSGAMGKVAEMVPSIEKMLPKIDSILGSLNTLLSDPALATSLHHVQTTTGNLALSSQQLNQLLANLNKSVPGLMTKANGVLDNADKLTGNLATLDVQGTLERVNRTVANAEAFTKKLNSDKGTLGLLLNDKQLYTNLNSTMRDADSLVVDLKQHPKRYVHFSLFGRKDK